MPCEEGKMGKKIKEVAKLDVSDRSLSKPHI